ncbi:g5514 [Coccomyxa elongata]
MQPVPAHFQKLVQLVGRAFYASECPPRDQDPEATQGPRKGTNAEFIGLGVITLDALTRREWVKEDELANELKAHPKVLRRVLRYFEQEQLVAREHRKEAHKRKQKGASSGRSSGDGWADGEGTASGLAGDVVVENEDELPPKALLHSYCTLDYGRLLDVTQLRLFKMRKALKDKLKDSNPVLEYVCPSCGARYTTLQAASLINFSDGEFHCEHCDSVLRSGRDEGAAGGGEGARQLRLKATKLLQEKMEEQLQPLFALLEDIQGRLARGGKIPSFGSLKDWALARMDAQRVANGTAGRLDEGPASIEVDIAGPATAPAPVVEAAPRELPPWLRAAAAASRGGPSASASAARSEESTGTGTDFRAQQASSTDQQDIQAAYVRQYLEQVKQTQAQLAAQTGGVPAGRNQNFPAEARSGSEGEKRLKTEHDWVAAPVKPEAQPKEAKDEEEWELAAPAGPPVDVAKEEEDSDLEWEEA